MNMNEYILIPQCIVENTLLKFESIVEVEWVTYCKVKTTTFNWLLESKIDSLQDDVNDAYRFLYDNDNKNDYIDSSTERDIENQCHPDDVAIEVWDVMYRNILKQDNTAEYEAWYISGLVEWRRILNSLINKFK